MNLKALRICFLGILSAVYVSGCHPAPTSIADARSQVATATPQQKANMIAGAPLPTSERIKEINNLPGLSDIDKKKYIARVH